MMWNEEFGTAWACRISSHSRSPASRLSMWPGRCGVLWAPRAVVTVPRPIRPPQVSPRAPRERASSEPPFSPPTKSVRRIRNNRHRDRVIPSPRRANQIQSTGAAQNLVAVLVASWTFGRMPRIDLPVLHPPWGSICINTSSTLGVCFTILSLTAWAMACPVRTSRSGSTSKCIST